MGVSALFLSALARVRESILMLLVMSLTLGSRLSLQNSGARVFLTGVCDSGRLIRN